MWLGSGGSSRPRVLPVASCLTLIRVRVPDRPGALGLVASRIGSLKGDIVGIEVLDRQDGIALDELAVVLPDADLIPAVTREINEVDGAEAESISIVEALPEPRLDAVRSAISLARTPTPEAMMQALSLEVAKSVRADWCAVVTHTEVLASTPNCPVEPSVKAIALIAIEGSGASVAIGRAHSLRSSEAELVVAWCEFAQSLLTYTRGTA